MKIFNSLVVLTLIIFAAVSVVAQDNNGGYFDKPHVYVEDDIYMPVGMLGTEAPPSDGIMWNIGSAYLSDTEFRSGGKEVQKNLGVRLWTLRGSIAKMYGNTYLGINVPFGIDQISGRIGALPASRSSYGLGDVALIAKRNIWNGTDGSVVMAGVGIELPTGKDNITFDQLNANTVAYYPGNVKRMPLAWQPGSGSTDLYTSISYNKTVYRRAYEAILACKFNGKGDSDVRLGNLTVFSLNATQALNTNLAASLGVIYRRQQNDSYPNAPAPGVGQTALAGTTQHGSSLSLSPSIRFRLKQKITVGLSFTFPVVKPDNGLVPENRWGIIASL